MKITWITGGGFIIERSGKRLVIDPYLSDIVERTLGWTRMVEVPVKLEELKPDIVFSTHDHIDHLDPEGVPDIAKHYPSCPFAGPSSVVKKLEDIGIDRDKIIRLDKGMSETLEGFNLTATPADHSDEHSVGLIIKADGKKIYISGDTGKRVLNRKV